MTGGLIFLAIVSVVVVIVIFRKSIKIIPQANAMVIERLGKYKKTLNSGFNIIFPIIDSPRELDAKIIRKTHDGRSIITMKKVVLIDLREGVYDFPRQNVITKDNVVIEIDAIIYYQINDSVKAMYEINNLPDAIEKLAKTTLRNIIGDMDLDGTLASRDEINTKMTDILDEATDKWGVKVNRVEIQDINPPQDIKDAMEKQMRAERDRRAAILTAEGDKQSQILESEGDKQRQINEADGEKRANILRAEGEAEAKVTVATAEAKSITLIANSLTVSGADPTTYLIAIKYIEALKDMADSNNSKVVYMPYEATGVLGSLGAVKEMFKDQLPGA